MYTKQIQKKTNKENNQQKRAALINVWTVSDANLAPQKQWLSFLLRNFMEMKPSNQTRYCLSQIGGTIRKM